LSQIYATYPENIYVYKKRPTKETYLVSMSQTHPTYPAKDLQIPENETYSNIHISEKRPTKETYIL